MALKLTSKASFRKNKTNSIMHIEFEIFLFWHFIRMPRWTTAMDQVRRATAAVSSSRIKSCCPLLSIWKWFFVVHFCIWLFTQSLTRPSPPLFNMSLSSNSLPSATPFFPTSFFFVRPIFIYALFHKA